MGGLFSKPAVPEPIAPAAPIEEATFNPGVEETDNDVKKRKLGKKRLQIPVGQTPAGSGLNTIQ